MLPIFIKNENLDKKPYRKVSILPHKLKVLERFLYNRLIMSCHQNFVFFIWFQKESQLAALALINDSGFEKAFLISLQSITYRCYSNRHSNSFDIVNHSLLLAKLESYGFSLTSLKLIQSYLVKDFRQLQ